MITTIVVYALIAYVLFCVLAVGLMIVIGLFEKPNGRDYPPWRL